MTVRELIEELKTCDQDALCVVQKDSEGNGYEKLQGADAAIYDEVGRNASSDNEYGVKCVVLFP